MPHAHAHDDPSEREVFLATLDVAVHAALEAIADQERLADDSGRRFELGEQGPREVRVLPWSASSAKHVRDVAKKLQDALPEDVNITREDLDEALPDLDLLGQVLDELLRLPEFSTLDGHPIEVNWTTRAITVRDVTETHVLMGRAAPTTQLERDTWRAESVLPPDFRVLLSLPCWLLASRVERERALHGLLITCGVADGRPVRRRPDIVAHAATLGRYGLSGPHEAQAVAHVMAHPSTRRRLAEYRFGPDGQGVFWRPTASSRSALDDLATSADEQPPLPTRPKPVPPASRRHGKDLAAQN